MMDNTELHMILPESSCEIPRNNCPLNITVVGGQAEEDSTVRLPFVLNHLRDRIVREQIRTSLNLRGYFFSLQAQTGKYF